MLMSTYREWTTNKAVKAAQRDYYEIMETKEDYDLGLRRVDHHFRHVCKKASVYRHGRRNALYSK